jgi:hypothetical protein
MATKTLVDSLNFEEDAIIVLVFCALAVFVVVAFRADRSTASRPLRARGDRSA